MTYRMEAAKNMKQYEFRFSNGDTFMSDFYDANLAQTATMVIDHAGRLVQKNRIGASGVEAYKVMFGEKPVKEEIKDKVISSSAIKVEEKHILGTEIWREYDFGGRKYRIDLPEQVRKIDEETHQVVDSEGIVHCVPAPGHNGCVLRWKSK